MCSTVASPRCVHTLNTLSSLSSSFFSSSCLSVSSASIISSGGKAVESSSIPSNDQKYDQQFVICYAVLFNLLSMNIS